MEKKCAEHTRIVLSNVNGLQPARWKNKKLEKLRAWMDKVEVDIIGLVELQTNWDMVHPRNCLPELLQGKVPLCTVQAHNKHNCRGTTFQQGGVAMVTIGALASKIMAWGADPMGLGHWCWQAFGGPGRTMRVVMAYQPVLQPNVTCVGASYQQQKWYW